MKREFNNWHETLDEFGELTKAKVYDKLEYSEWRKLVKQADTFSLERSAVDAQQIIAIWDDGAYLFNIDDNSLGEFVYNKYFDNIKTMKKENKEMSKMFKFDFGKVNSYDVRLSVYGVAVKNAEGTWVAYDKTAGNLIDVDILNFDGSQFLYKMPVALDAIAAGDILMHQGKPVFVVSVDGGIMVVDPVAGERKVIEPLRSPFGFNFYTKIVNFVENFGGFNATAENPMGNIWMLMAMGDGKDLGDLLPLMMMSGVNGFNAGNMNPMMLMALSGKGFDSDMLPFLMMMGNGAAPAAQ